MKELIGLMLQFLAELFDKVPVLSALKGYRSALGLVAIGVVKLLGAKGIISASMSDYITDGLGVFTGLALNATGRTPDAAVPPAPATK